jgi:CheY-like chemotaxis protein
MIAVRAPVHPLLARRESRRASADFHMAVMDLRLPNLSGFEVLRHLTAAYGMSDVPVVIFTGRELTTEEDALLHSMARSVVFKDVKLPERRSLQGL